MSPVSSSLNDGMASSKLLPDPGKGAKTSTSAGFITSVDSYSWKIGFNPFRSCMLLCQFCSFGGCFRCHKYL